MHKYVHKHKYVWVKKKIHIKLVRDPIRLSTLASSISQAITFPPVTTTKRTLCPSGGNKPASTSTTGQKVVFYHQTLLGGDNIILKTHVLLFSDCGISVLSSIFVFKDTEPCSEGLELTEPTN